MATEVSLTLYGKGRLLNPQVGIQDHHHWGLFKKKIKILHACDYLPVTVLFNFITVDIHYYISFRCTT